MALHTDGIASVENSLIVILELYTSVGTTITPTSKQFGETMGLTAPWDYLGLEVGLMLVGEALER